MAETGTETGTKASSKPGISAQAKAEAAVAAAPEGSVEWARATDDLAEACLAAEQEPDSDALPFAALDAAIEVRRDALARLGPAAEQAVGHYLRNNLAVDLSSRYQRGGDLADLTEACDLGAQYVSRCDVSERLSAVANLAGRMSLLARYEGHEPKLDRAIDMVTAALGQADAADQNRMTAVTCLAGLRVHQWERDGDLTALKEAVAAIPVGEVTGATPGVLNVASLLQEYAEQTGDAGLFRQTEGLLRDALVSVGPDTAAVLRGTLANTLIKRFELDGGEARLTEAIDLADAAIAATAGPALAGHLATRSMARFDLSRLHGDREQLDAAIDDARAAVGHARDTFSDLSEAANSLAMLVSERYDLLGDSADLDASIALYDELIERYLLAAADSMAAMRNNLASSLLTRFERDGQPADLARAADLADQAIQDTLPTSVHLAARHDTAGRVRAALAHHLGSEADADRAEYHARAAVEATPPASPDRSHYLNNWAMWATARWERTADPSVLKHAIELLESALAQTSDEGTLRATINFNLGARLQTKFEHDLSQGTGNWAELQRACDLLDEALSAGLPHLTLPAGKRLGDIAWRVSMWPQAEHALRLSLAAAGELSGERPQRADKQRARSGVQGIGALAALCAVRSGDDRAAAVHLEQASATLLAESLGVRGTKIRFGDITKACRRMRRSLLLLGSTPAGGIAILTGAAGEARHAELPGLTEDAVREVTAAFRQVLTNAIEADADGEGGALEDCYAAGERLVGWTYSQVLAPLGALLKNTGPLALLPLGRLAWLPLTGAGPPGAAPALAAHHPIVLIRAAAGPPVPASANRAARRPARRRSGPLRASVWADTGPADNYIPGVIDEARRVAAAYQQPRLHLRDRRAPIRQSRANGERSVLRSSRLRDRTPPASADAGVLMSEIFAADVAHLACHCDVDLDRPDDSIVYLDPPVRVGDLRAGSPRADTHVVLSACDAALTATSLPDEALSPATAFLMAGAATVTASVWPVDDEATGEFMVQYHQALAAGVEPGRALSQLQARWALDRPAFLYAPWVAFARPAAG